MTEITVGYALCGSFCTFSKTIPQMKELVKSGYKVLPLMSETEIIQAPPLENGDYNYITAGLWAGDKITEIQ